MARQEPESERNWWQRRRWYTKIAIVLGGIWAVMVLLAVIRADVASDQPTPPLTPTFTQAERHSEYTDKMIFACSYAVAGDFNRDRMVALAEYDYGVYAGIIVKSYLKKKDIARQCHYYR